MQFRTFELKKAKCWRNQTIYILQTFYKYVYITGFQLYKQIENERNKYRFIYVKPKYSRFIIESAIYLVAIHKYKPLLLVYIRHSDL